jgi:hypothetical protein
VLGHPFRFLIEAVDAAQKPFMIFPEENEDADAGSGKGVR